MSPWRILGWIAVLWALAYTLVMCAAVVTAVTV